MSWVAGDVQGSSVTMMNGICGSCVYGEKRCRRRKGDVGCVFMTVTMMQVLRLYGEDEDW